MKKMLLILVLLALKYTAMAQELKLPVKTNIYLVRHAEKEPGNDPLLTEAGKKRAGDLVRVLKDKHVQRIYVTRTRRSQMTADSMNIQLGIDTVHYDGDTTGEDFIKKFNINRDQGKVILVIGHSNTIPKILKALGVAEYKQYVIPDNEFDDLFLVKYKRKKVIVKRRKYGELSQVSASMHPGQ